MRACIMPCLITVMLICMVSNINAARFGTWNSILREDHVVVQPKLSGYLPVDHKGNEVYYAYFESEATPAEDVGESPIILWLQGGPGCASTFGGFYELGPYMVTENLTLVENPGAWTHGAGLLLIDQPIGTGLSFVNSSDDIPMDEMGMATHLYEALQAFFTQHWHLRSRPFFITGESYGGKYVPSIAHYILQAAAQAQPPSANGAQQRTASPVLRYTRALRSRVQPPIFKLAGIAIGNGLTEPRAQTQTLAGVAWSAGLMSSALRNVIAARAQQVVKLIDSKQWQQAHETREELRSIITNATGIATMFDTRRTQDYDPNKAVDRYFNQAVVREAMRAKREGTYASCSEEVGAAMAADTMQSVAHLFPDLLDHLHVLLYQGQYDIVDGPVSTAAWVEGLQGWSLLNQFNAANSTLWYLADQDNKPLLTQQQQAQEQAAAAQAAAQKHTSQPLQRPVGTAAAGWVRSAGRLTHAVVYRAGHMVPQDQPLAARQLLENWILDALSAE